MVFIQEIADLTRNEMKAKCKAYPKEAFSLMVGYITGYFEHCVKCNKKEEALSAVDCLTSIMSGVSDELKKRE